MRILYIDIDSQRPDHLGCYGYHRNTSPNIDLLARDGVRFDNCYITDAPCLPSRTALWSGRCGYHTGVVGHGGTAAQPIIEGPQRGFSDLFGTTGWMAVLRAAGLRTVTVSSFGERHSAWHWYAGFSEIINPGFMGLDRADQVCPLALDWLGRNARADNWFLHVNLWDPHTPYSTPQEFGNPFENDPLADWYNEELRQRSWDGFGPHCAQDLQGFGWEEFSAADLPRVSIQLDSMAAVKRWIDGYDVGIRYADAWIGRMLNALADAGVLEETAIIIGADHGENQGELNVWGDHQTADEITCRVPLIIRWPGMRGGRVDRTLHYHYDWAATLIELVGGKVPANWDGQPFTAALREGREVGRPYLVTSQGAWACQRGVRFDNYMLLRTYHDGLKDLPPLLLFDLVRDPHEQHDLVDQQPDVVQRGLRLLEEWQYVMALSSPSAADPLMTVLREGGPFHTRGFLPRYLQRLRETGRERHAETLAARHPSS